jgi:hypothetical protein
LEVGSRKGLVAVFSHLDPPRRERDICLFGNLITFSIKSKIPGRRLGIFLSLFFLTSKFSKERKEVRAFFAVIETSKD